MNACFKFNGDVKPLFYYYYYLVFADDGILDKNDEHSGFDKNSILLRIVILQLTDSFS